MKKKLIITSVILAIALVFVFLNMFQSKNVATVNDVKISLQRLNDRIKYAEIMNEAYITTFNEVYSNEKEKNEQITKIILSTEKEKVLEEMITAEIIRQDLKKKNKCISRRNVEKTVDLEFEFMKEDVSQQTFYKNLKNVLLKNNLSEKDFLKLMYVFAFDQYNYNQAERIFFESIKNDKNNIMLQKEKFIDYINILRKSKSIVYY